MLTQVMEGNMGNDEETEINAPNTTANSMSSMPANPKATGLLNELP